MYINVKIAICRRAVYGVGGYVTAVTQDCGRP